MMRKLSVLTSIARESREPRLLQQVRHVPGRLRVRIGVWRWHHECVSRADFRRKALLMQLLPCTVVVFVIASEWVWTALKVDTVFFPPLCCIPRLLI